MIKNDSRTKRLLQTLSNRLSLKGHLDVVAAARDIQSNITFSGPNTYILAIAIIIASVGLNVNSIPVIIGAMLISPLMGPIIGLGLSLGTNDFRMLRDSLKNLAIMVTISIVASTLYFLLTPLKLDNPTELLARTNPTIYDVLIATFSGFAGIIETCRKNKGTVIAGVAIATALMPPLCTIGFGLATLNLHYALGALYLFFINSVFIAFATFAGVKYLKFKSSTEVDAVTQRRHQRWIILIVTLMIIPSIITAVRMVRQNNFERNADDFVASCREMPNNYIYDHVCDHKTSPSSIELLIVSDDMDSVGREAIYTQAEHYNISRSQIRFKASLSGIGFSNKMVKDLMEREASTMAQKDSTIARQHRELEALRARDMKKDEIITLLLEEKTKAGK